MKSTIAMFRDARVKGHKGGIVAVYTRHEGVAGKEQTVVHAIGYLVTIILIKQNLHSSLNNMNAVIVELFL